MVRLTKKEAIKCFNIAADKGNTEAMMQYGNILSLGIDIPPNFNEAEKYLKAAADKCNVDAIILYDSHLKRKGNDLLS